jgi:hypothetical protein
MCSVVGDEDISRLTCDAMWLEGKVQREAAAARQGKSLASLLPPFLKRGCGPMPARTLLAAIFTSMSRLLFYLYSTILDPTESAKLLKFRGGAT